MKNILIQCECQPSVRPGKIYTFNGTQYTVDVHQDNYRMFLSFLKKNNAKKRRKISVFQVT